jgi:microcystin-dependent protein
MENFIQKVKELEERIHDLEKREGPSGIPTGTIIAFPSSTIPNGFLLCDGSAVSRTTYANLFAVIGTTYGAGDGSTTFNLPNLKGKVPVGFDSSQTEFNALGKTGGAKTHTLSVDEMPSHTHTQNAHRHWISSANRDDGNGTGCMTNNQMFGLWADAGSYSANDPGYGYGRYSQWETATNQNTGGGQAHNNLQPYITLKFAIKT